MRRVDQLEFSAARRGEGMTRLCPTSVDVVYDSVRLTRTATLFPSSVKQSFSGPTPIPHQLFDMCLIFSIMQGDYWSI